MWGRMMDWERKREILQMLESFGHTDNSDLDSEKTAVIAELLAEVEHVGNSGGTRGDSDATSD